LLIARDITFLAGLGAGTARSTETSLLTPGNLAGLDNARRPIFAIRYRLIGGMVRMRRGRPDPWTTPPAVVGRDATVLGHEGLDAGYLVAALIVADRRSVDGVHSSDQRLLRSGRRGGPVERRPRSAGVSADPGCPQAAVAAARWLAADGYQVQLVDPMPLHVRHAAAIAGVHAVLGDARRLDEPDAGYQVTLLLGPLYHLPDRRDRVTALREAVRVTVPGGVIAAATISRYAGLYDTLLRGRYLDPRVRQITDTEVVTGVHEPFDQDLFTLAYFHHPDEVVDEFADAGLTPAVRYALEGGSWLFVDRDGWLEGDERTAALLEALRSVEQEPSLFGITAHLLTVAVVE
jgi:SAM-dependent methyltransferase